MEQPAVVWCLLPKEHYIAFIMLITVGRGLAPAAKQTEKGNNIYADIHYRLFAKTFRFRREQAPYNRRLFPTGIITKGDVPDREAVKPRLSDG